MVINQDPDKWFKSTVTFSTPQGSLELPLPANTSAETNGLRSSILVGAAIVEALNSVNDNLAKAVTLLQALEKRSY